MGGAQVILLDTQAAVWVALDDRALGKRTRGMVEKAAKDGDLTISAISFWEIALLIAKRRMRRPDSVRELRLQLLSQGTAELPLTGEIGIAAAELDSLHGDPADRFIAATAIAHDATLITADEKLLRWRHPLRRQNAEL
jgi:PIN domain nuclease of toxin-antitoxin system